MNDPNDEDFAGAGAAKRPSEETVEVCPLQEYADTSGGLYLNRFHAALDGSLFKIGSGDGFGFYF